jgi:type I restriction enzyme S subunit
MNAEQLLAHYERIAEAPDAIARLRRFVLDLAVRGKLVAQNAADEPASELLDRTAQIAASLEQGRKTKQRKLDFGNQLEELPFDLPNGWATAPLRDLVRVLNGRAYKQPELLAAGTPVLRVGNLFTSDKWYYSDLDLDDDKHCEAGDLIYSWSASFGPFIWDGPRVIFHYHIWKLPLISEADLDKQYLYTFLLQKTREIKEAGHGISMVHMTKEKMERLVVPLPPLAEQHRIVAKVDELMALCDRLEEARKEREAARDRLTAASLARLNAPDPDPATFTTHARFALDNLPALTTRADQIKQLRQTILNLAVRGKLGEQRATEHGPELPSQKARAIAEGKIAAKIPMGWKWALVSEVASSRLGKMLDKAKNRGHEFPYLRNTNVHWFEVRTDDTKDILLTDEEVETYLLQNGDVLICEGGHGIGRTAVWRGEVSPMTFQKALHRVRPGEHLDSDFLAFCCFVYYNEGVMQTYFTGVGIPHFTGKALAKLLFPLPPLAEQHRIVAKVHELMALCDRLEASLATGDETRQRLLEAVLHEALEPADAQELEPARAA